VRETLRVRVEMSFRVKKYLPVLKQLSKLSDRVQREYIRKSDKEFIDYVSECAKNVPLTSHQKTNLRRRKNDLRALSSKKTSLRQKRTILQKGGFLSVLLPPLMGILSSLLLK